MNRFITHNTIARPNQTSSDQRTAKMNQRHPRHLTNRNHNSNIKQGSLFCLRSKTHSFFVVVISFPRMKKRVEVKSQKKRTKNKLGFRRGGAAVPAGQPPLEPALPPIGEDEDSSESSYITHNMNK